MVVKTTIVNTAYIQLLYLHCALLIMKCAYGNENWISCAPSPCCGLGEVTKGLQTDLWGENGQKDEGKQQRTLLS